VEGVLLQSAASAAIIARMSAKSRKKEAGEVAVNKKAFHNFEIEDRLEAGMELLGSEVKSCATAGGPYRLIRRES